ncbi:hypothetical protein E2C01_031040 [Portunus trituberculatus]|uniref:Uncharacterized protein n=1 Tax=Portunus trituberculatus TaxID=210409 RepID=A0A5B7EZ05_PORTR|nr:hypothetical protein [Portunus trituberculatus]
MELMLREREEKKSLLRDQERILFGPRRKAARHSYGGPSLFLPLSLLPNLACALSVIVCVPRLSASSPVVPDEHLMVWKPIQDDMS